MNHTPNYQLSQWVKSDKVQMEDFNADNAKIDAALKAHADTLSAHAAQLAKLGNCQIYTTTYTGTGEFGPDHPNTLTFPKKPLFLFVTHRGGNTFQFFVSRDVYSQENRYFTWSGNSVSWYSSYNALDQLNSNSDFAVVALLKAD